MESFGISFGMGLSLNVLVLDLVALLGPIENADEATRSKALPFFRSLSWGADVSVAVTRSSFVAVPEVLRLTSTRSLG